MTDYVYLSVWLNDEGEVYCEESNHSVYIHDNTRYAGIVRGGVRVVCFVKWYNDVDDRLTREILQKVAKNYLDGNIVRHNIDFREW